jgi:hypothetical protein
VLAGTERGACVELVAHVAALDARPAVYAAEGYGSLFSYCTQALGLSEDAACKRSEQAPDRSVGDRTGAATRRAQLGAQAAHPHGDATLVASVGDDERLRRVQALLRREIPDGDPAAIFDRALALLLDKVEKAKLGAAANPRAIRPRTDERARSRAVPRAVKRGSWSHEGGQGAFVSRSGRRCSERTFLEFHHVQPHAKQGPATLANISLRCWRHNQYEAELVFGPRRQKPQEQRGGRDG